jgi:hypothetical protein
MAPGYLTSKFWQIVRPCPIFLLVHFLLSCQPYIFRVEFVLLVNLYYLCSQGCSLKLKIQLKMMVNKMETSSTQGILENLWSLCNQVIENKLCFFFQGLNSSYYLQWFNLSPVMSPPRRLQNTNFSKAQEHCSCLIAPWLQNSTK